MSELIELIKAGQYSISGLVFALLLIIGLLAYFIISKFIDNKKEKKARTSIYSIEDRVKKILEFISDENGESIVKKLLKTGMDNREIMQGKLGEIHEKYDELFAEINALREIINKLCERDSVNGQALKELIKNIDQVVTRLIDFSGNIQVILNDVGRIYDKLDRI